MHIHCLPGVFLFSPCVAASLKKACLVKDKEESIVSMGSR